MTLIWDPLYSVNVKEIDDQHKEIFDIINHVHSLAERSIPADEMVRMIEKLKAYSVYHFATEEKYFKQFNYPGAEPHIAQHNLYKERVAEMERELTTNSGESNYRRLDTLLQDWWLGHIQNIDMQYSDFFNDHGLF